MMKQKPRSPAGSGSSEEREWGIAGIALLIIPALLTGLLLVGIEKDWVGFGGRPPVTVRQSADGNRPQTARPASGTAAWPATGESRGRMLADGLSLEPEFTNGRIAGYRISEKSSAPILAAAKLRPGDILFEADGRPLDPSRLGELRRELARADSIELTFERNGQIRKRVIDLRR